MCLPRRHSGQRICGSVLLPSHRLSPLVRTAAAIRAVVAGLGTFSKNSDLRSSQTLAVLSLPMEASMKKNKLWIGLGAAAVATVFVWWTAHTPRQVNGSGEHERDECVPAAVVRVCRGPIENGMVLAGNFKAFQDVDVHAKVAGYIRTIYVDVGDHVKEGQVLAVLEVPELAAELAGSDAAVRRAKEEVRRAEGDVVRAKSTHAAAHAMSERLTQAAKEKQGLVAQQEVDDAQAKDLESEAQVSSSEAALSSAQQALEVAQANQKQFRALSEYT